MTTGDHEVWVRERGWKTADLTPGMWVHESAADPVTGWAPSFQGTAEELCRFLGIGAPLPVVRIFHMIDTMSEKYVVGRMVRQPHELAPDLAALEVGQTLWRDGRWGWERVQ